MDQDSKRICRTPGAHMMWNIVRFPPYLQCKTLLMEKGLVNKSPTGRCWENSCQREEYSPEKCQQKAGIVPGKILQKQENCGNIFSKEEIFSMVSLFPEKGLVTCRPLFSCLLSL